MDKKLSMSGEIKALEIGQEAVFPAEKCQSVTSAASQIAFALNRKYRSRKDTVNRTISIIREA